MTKLISVNSEQIGPWVAKKLSTAWCPQISAAIGLIERSSDGSEKIIAGAIFSNFNGASMHVHLVGEGKRWMTKSYLGFCFQYVFIQCKVKKLIGMVAEDNHDARCFDAHIGFQLETSIPDADPAGAILIYTMTPAQCRWLDIQVPKEAMYG